MGYEAVTAQVEGRTYQFPVWLERHSVLPSALRVSADSTGHQVRLPYMTPPGREYRRSEVSLFRYTGRDQTNVVEDFFDRIGFEASAGHNTGFVTVAGLAPGTYVLRLKRTIPSPTDVDITVAHPGSVPNAPLRLGPTLLEPSLRATPLTISHLRVHEGMHTPRAPAHSLWPDVAC